MLVIPAIDIRGGLCVRLTQGDYARETVYDDDPVAVARRWAEYGAVWLHVVDLDGAAGDGPRNLPVVERIIAAIGIPVELGGGLKREADVEAALDRGVGRVVLGTAALEDAAMVEHLAARFGERIVVGVDARDGKVAMRGWRETSTVTALTLAREMVARGVGRFIYTDIARDGTLTEPNYAALAQLQAAVTVPIIASGGVSRLEHLRRLAELRVEGAIVGRALYTGHVDLREALRLTEPEDRDAH
ncbi:MAG: 1-(5-phosphoribosyl)-5-[(5-phosphoribosylamino)methylideneamino]imidazole-4-carboxamide isomerase [Chloroflexota bacterium]